MAWTPRTKPSSSWEERDSGIENYLLCQDNNFLTFQDGSLIVWSDLSQYDNRTPPDSDWDNERKGYLLKEDSYYLLLEDGFKIVIAGVDTGWTNRTPVSTAWT